MINKIEIQIKQEEKNMENEQGIQKKKKKKFGLNIDTEAINQMYTFGGENGQQIVISA
jgi:hypothetical protein